MQHVVHNIHATCQTRPLRAHTSNRRVSALWSNAVFKRSFASISCPLSKPPTRHAHVVCVTRSVSQYSGGTNKTSTQTPGRRHTPRAGAKGAGRTWAECPLMTAACACLACCTCAVSTSHRMFHSLNMPVKVSQHTEWGILPPLTERGQRNRCEQRHARKAVGSEASRKESRIMSHES